MTRSEASAIRAAFSGHLQAGQAVLPSFTSWSAQVSTSSSSGTQQTRGSISVHWFTVHRLFPAWCFSTHQAQVGPTCLSLWPCEQRPQVLSCSSTNNSLNYSVYKWLWHLLPAAIGCLSKSKACSLHVPMRAGRRNCLLS